MVLCSQVFPSFISIVLKTKRYPHGGLFFHLYFQFTPCRLGIRMLVYGTAFTRSRHQDWRFDFFLFLSFICAAFCLMVLYPISFSFGFVGSACVRFHFNFVCVINNCTTTIDFVVYGIKNGTRGKRLLTTLTNFLFFVWFRFTKKKNFLVRPCFAFFFPQHVDITIPFLLFFRGTRGEYPRAENGGP